VTVGVGNVRSTLESGVARHIRQGPYSEIATASSHSSRHRMSASRQPHRELGEVTDFAVDRDSAAVLLGYDLVADRQSKPGALSGRLGREKGLEQLVPVFRRNADAIVAHPDFDAFAELAGCDLQCGAVSAVFLAAPFTRVNSCGTTSTGPRLLSRSCSSAMSKFGSCARAP